MKRLRLVLIFSLTLLIVMCFSVLAYAAEYPYGASIDGTNMYGELKRAGNEDDHDIYHLTLGKAGKLSYEVSAEGQMIKFAVDDGTDRTLSFFIHKGETETGYYELNSGEYDIYISNYGNNDASYSFNLRWDPSDETYSYKNNDYTDVVTKTPLEFGKTIVGHFGHNDSVDVYRVELKKSGTLNIKIEDVVDTMLYFLAKDGTAITNHAIRDYQDDNYSIDLAAGIYYVKLENNGGQKAYGTHHILPTFKASGETFKYDNNTREAVTGKKATKPCKKVKGHIAVNDSDDYYKITIPKKGDYYLILDFDEERGITYSSFQGLTKGATPVNYKWKIDGNGKQTTFEYENLAKGTYYLHFQDTGTQFYPNTGKYSFCVKPSTPLLSVGAGKKSFNAGWYKINVTGYQLQYTVDKKFKSSIKKVNISKGDTTNKVVKKLKAKKTYYVRVRSYIKVGSKKYYSDWSDIQKVKTKK